MQNLLQTINFINIRGFLWSKLFEAKDDMACVYTVAASTFVENQF